jgi:hypothetical protein
LTNSSGIKIISKPRWAVELYTFWQNLSTAISARAICLKEYPQERREAKKTSPKQVINTSRFPDRGKEVCQTDRVPGSLTGSTQRSEHAKAPGG